MNVFSTEDIDRFSRQGEAIFCAEARFIVDRFKLTILPNVAEYELPSYVLEIRKVMWKGRKIDPVSHRVFRDYHNLMTHTGRPIEYVHNNIGKNKIRFFPIPNEAITDIGNAHDSTDIANLVIIDFCRTTDFALHRLPDFIGRRFLKTYVAMRCFGIEGRGQNIKAAQYYTKKWAFQTQYYKDVIFDIINKPRKLVSNELEDFHHRHPVFATRSISKFGIGVDR